MAAKKVAQRAETYTHEEEALLRPDVGTQAQFKKKKPPKTHRYDSSLSPALDWDGQNSPRELGEWLIAQIDEASKLDPPHRFSKPRSFNGVEIAGLADAVERLKALSEPFLDWAGKAERDDIVGLGDARLFELMASERRVIVTENVADFAVLVRQAAGAGREYAGVVFTSPETFPRAKATIGLFVEALDQLLRAEPAEDALGGRAHWLSHP